MDLGLSGKACIVTGATSGIGAATARMLVGEGARVLLVARGEERLAAAVAELGSPAAVAVDVTEPDAAERIVGVCEDAFGAVDVLVNNAGTARIASLDQTTDADWTEQWELNVMAPMRLMRAAAPRMAERGWGRVVNVASSSGKRPSGRFPAYSVAKAAQLSLSRLFADHWAGRGVLVNAVAPGPISSPLWMGEGGLADQSGDRAEALASTAGKIPLGRMGTPEEIAAVIVFLCSEQAANVTGASWSADGGSVPFFI